MFILYPETKPEKQGEDGIGVSLEQAPNGCLYQVIGNQYALIVFDGGVMEIEMGYKMHE